MQTKIKMGPILERATDSRIPRHELEKDFEKLNAHQLEIVANTPYLTRDAQELLAKPGRYEGIHIILANNHTVLPDIKKRLDEILHQPVRIFTIVKEERIPKLHRK